MKTEKVFSRIHLTSVCNQHCAFCARPGGDISETSITQVRREIAGLSAAGVNGICFTGGEPLLYSRLNEAISCSRDHGMISEIQTNGTLLTERKIAELKEAGIDIMSISYPSHIRDISRRLRGVDAGFSEAPTSIAGSNRLGIMTQVVHVISEPNYRDLPGFVDHILSLDLDPDLLSLNLSIIIPSGRAFVNRYSLIPKMSDIKPYLIEACDRCRAARIHFDISKIVPLCIAEGHEESVISTVFKMNNAMIVEGYRVDRDPIESVATSDIKAMKASQCETCSLDDICAGFYPQLAEMYGSDDYVPSSIDPEEIIRRLKSGQNDRHAPKGGFAENS